MKSSSRQGRLERTEHANRLKGVLNLTKHPGFGQEYGPLVPGGNPADYITYTHLGYKIQLRFSQLSGEWKAVCPGLEIETTVPHQHPQDIQQILNDWLQDHLPPPVAPAVLRQARPSRVQELATKHGISVDIALELYAERGF